MHYASPFHLIDDGHGNCDPLCLSLEHEDDASVYIWGGFYQSAVMLMNAGMDQPAFFMARHFVELSLKQLRPVHGHKLDELLYGLGPADPLLTAVDGDEASIREFILDLATVDPDSTNGRYSATKGGPAFQGVCCVNRSQLREHLRSLFNYVSTRTGSPLVSADGT